MESKEHLVNRSAIKWSEGRCAATRFRELCNILNEVPGVMRKQWVKGRVRGAGE
jgi:hypothetical protein